MRHHDWQERYHAAIKNAQLVPFTWGVHDCITFAAYMVDAISDTAVTVRMRERYSWTSEAEARALIEKAGSLRTLIEEFMGEAVPWAQTTLGDAVLAIQNGKEIVAIHDGSNLIAPDAVGIAGVPLSCAVVGWRI